MSENQEGKQFSGCVDRTKEAVPYKGIAVELQNMKVIMPPLNFEALYLHDALEKLDKLKNAMLEVQNSYSLNIPKPQLKDFIELTTMAIQRNYPDVTEQDVIAGLDFENMNELMGFLLVQNQTEEMKKHQEKVNAELLKNAVKATKQK
jgi:hypothetical protein